MNMMGKSFMLLFTVLFVSLWCLGQTNTNNWKNVNYAGDQSEAHNLDIYVPESSKPANVIIIIYGSAWFSDKSKDAAFKAIGQPLTDAGFAVVSINHRSSTEAKWPAQINDVKAAIRFVRANAAAYGYDTSFIGITGYSSGGHLSAFAGVSNHVKKISAGNTAIDIEGSIGNYTNTSSSVDAVVDWFGPVDMSTMKDCSKPKGAGSPEAVLLGCNPEENPDLVALCSVNAYIDKNDVPFLIFHGTADNVVPYCQSESFNKNLLNAGVRSRFVPVPEGGHGPGCFAAPNFTLMTDFFRSERNARDARRTIDHARFNRKPTPGDTLHSTKVLANGDVVFQIYAPYSEDVTLGGDVVPWRQKIVSHKAENGIWTITIPGLKAGTYRYHFVVDGIKVFDPKARNASETSALLDVTPEGEKEFFSLRKEIPHGAMAEINYYSKTTESLRRMHIWTPPGYNAGTGKLPVLYLIHGGGDSDAAWPEVGRAGFIMDNLLSEGKCKRMIVVFPNGAIDTRLFAQDLGNDIIPYIESNYRVLTGANNRAIAGLSMGGLETMDSFMAFPDKFAYINVMSSGWFANNKEMYEAGDKRLAEIAPVLRKIVKYLLFTQGGPEDIAYKNCKEMLKVFDKYGISYEFREMPGGHSWYVWRNDLKNLAPKLFK